MIDDPILDSSVWSALTGPQAHLARGDGDVREYLPSVAYFAAVRDWTASGVWEAITEFRGPGADFPLPPAGVAIPQGWEITRRIEGVQLIETPDFVPEPAPARIGDYEFAELGAADAAEMLDLVERTRPGPFLSETYKMGRYVGYRLDGELVALAGERVRPIGWTEISAVCTDLAHRGHGLAAALVHDVGLHIRARGDRVYLHTLTTNPARALYTRLGFQLRRELTFGSIRIPDA